MPFRESSPSSLRLSSIAQLENDEEMNNWQNVPDTYDHDHEQQLQLNKEEEERGTEEKERQLKEKRRSPFVWKKRGKIKKGVEKELEWIQEMEVGEKEKEVNGNEDS